MDWDDARVANAVAAVMRKQGFTIRKLADVLGLPYRTVQNYLTGTVRLPASFVDSVSTIFAVEADYLVTGTVILERDAFYEAVEHVLGELALSIKVVGGRASLVSTEPNGEQYSESLPHRVKANSIDVANAIRSRFIERRNALLDEHGTGGVFPLGLYEAVEDRESDEQ